MVYKYAFQGYDKEKMSRALGVSLKGLSHKDGIEIGKFIKGKKVSDAIAYLEGIPNFERAIPYTRFNSGLGHQKGKVGSGRYPIKASMYILKLLKSAVANANDKNLNTDILVIKHVCAQKGPSQYHYGRHHGRQVKQSHIEIVLYENAKIAEKKAVNDAKRAEKKSKSSDSKKEN